MADTAALVVALSAQLTKFEKDMQKAQGIAARGVQRIESEFAQSNPGVAFGTRFIKGFLSAVAAGQLARAVREVIGQLDDIGDAAERVGVSTEAFQALRFALEQSGGSAEQMDKAFDRLSDSISEAALGTTYLTKVFEANGIALKDGTTGELKTLEQLLPSVAQLFAGLTVQSDKVKLSADLFGRQAGPKMIAVMEELARRGLPALIASGKEAGAVIDNELIRKANDLDIAFREASGRISKAFKEVAVDAAPLLISALNGIARALQGIKDNAEKINIAAALETGTANAEQLSKAIALARSKGSPVDPSWIKALDDLLEKQREFNRAQSFSNRPPPDLAQPAPPPKTVLPPTTKDPIEELLKAQEKHIELTKAETEAVGLSAGAQERLRVETQLTQSILAQDKSPEAYAERIRKIGAAAEEAANTLARRQFQFEELSSASRDLGSALSEAFKGATIEGQKFDQVLRNLASRLASRSIDKLFDLAFAPQAGATTSIFTDLLKALPGLASGGSVKRDEPVVVGERGPELFVPNQSGMVMPNKVGSSTSGGGVNLTIQNNVDATGADTAAIARLEQGLAASNRSIEQRAVNAVAAHRLRFA